MRPLAIRRPRPNCMRYTSGPDTAHQVRGTSRSLPWPGLVEPGELVDHRLNRKLCFDVAAGCAQTAGEVRIAEDVPNCPGQAGGWPRGRGPRSGRRPRPRRFRVPTWPPRACGIAWPRARGWAGPRSAGQDHEVSGRHQPGYVVAMAQEPHPTLEVVEPGVLLEYRSQWPSPAISVRRSGCTC